MFGDMEEMFDEAETNENWDKNKEAFDDVKRSNSCILTKLLLQFT